MLLNIVTGLNPLLTREETKQYAMQAVTRASLRENFTPKLGRFEYSVGKYSNLVRAIIPFDEGEEQTYLLLSLQHSYQCSKILKTRLRIFWQMLHGRTHRGKNVVTYFQNLKHNVKFSIPLLNIYSVSSCYDGRPHVIKGFGEQGWVINFQTIANPANFRLMNEWSPVFPSRTLEHRLDLQPRSSGNRILYKKIITPMKKQYTD